MWPSRPRFMELSSRKTSKRAIEPVDEWLQNEGYYRKHAPKDPTCLFRAISEQVYHSQRNHITVRNECIEFMKKNRHMFEEKISTPFDSYLDQMACFTEWGGMNEVLAMSLLYQRNVVVFHGQNLTKETVMDHGFQHTLNLCFTPPKQYESVYTQEHTSDAGFCQSIVYQTLYKKVFNMTNVDTTVHKMLHERTNHLRHDKFFLKGNMEIRNQLTVELMHKLEDNEDDSEETQLLAKGITPFPYRVAKALDPNIYRNVDYDIWHEIRKEVRNSGYTKFYSNELQAGSKCLVQLDLREDRANNNFLTGKENWDTNKAPIKGKHMEPLFYTGHIQEMSKNEGPVVVFIEELGEKMTVPYKCLKAFPVQRKMRQNPFPAPPNKKNMIPQNTKWKKPYNNQTRKVKEMTPTDNNVDRNQINKPVAKNAMNKSEWGSDASLENQQAKMQPETYLPYQPHPPQKDYNAAVESVKVMLENTHVTSVEAAERVISEQTKSKPAAVNVDTHDNQFKKQPPNNYNHDVNQPNKQHYHQRAEKNEIFYPPYQNGGYFVSPRFPNNTEYVNYDVKNGDAENGKVPNSDPAAVHHFYNLGVKYYWAQNTYPPPGGNGPVFGENTYYITQPPPDVNVGVNVINGLMPPNEHMNQTGNPNQPNINPNHPNNHNNNNGNNGRHNYRSSTPRLEGNNGPRQNGQKSNYRQANQQNHYQSQNVDFNRNRVDHKNSNVNDQQQQQQQYMQNKDMQRGNKNNQMAPRFKKNYDGRNRGEHQYQYNPDYRYNKNRQQQQQQQQQTQPQQQQQQSQSPIENTTLEMNEASMQIQQQQQHSQPPPLPPTSVMQPQQQQQQQAQTPPPPINGNYPYPLYNQQVSYVPIGPYPIDAEAFPGHFYPGPPASFLPMPYLPPPELADGPPGGPPPLYSPIEAFAPQYPAIYSPQFVPYHLPPPMYPSPPPSSAPAGIPEGCYPAPPFPGQPYFLPYPPPPLPANLIPSPQNSPAH